MSLWRHLGPSQLGETLRAFTSSEVVPAAEEIDRVDRYPVEIVTEMAGRGWNTLTLPEEFGGAAAPIAHQLAVFEEVSVGSAALGISLITIFQSQKIIEKYGTPSLKERILPQYNGGLRASFALTEPGHGSDIRSLDTKAHRSGDGWVLDGEKAFITSGSAATLFVVLAETPIGVSTFAVPREATGISAHETEQAATFGLRNGPHINLRLEGVHLPGDALIGTEGRGLKQAMVTLANSRVLAAGISLGIARAAYEGALRYAMGREAFGSRVIDFQGIQWYFAEAAAKIDAARLLAYQSAADLTADRDIARITSSGKLIASKLATEVAEMAVQVCGALGTRQSEPFGRYLRDAKAYEVAGGSSEILKNTIAKSVIQTMRDDPASTT